MNALFGKEGPTVVQHGSYASCGSCKWHDQRMLMSGMNPIYEHFCMHPKSVEPSRFPGFVDGKFIGRDDHTPDWCPVREGTPV